MSDTSDVLTLIDIAPEVMDALSSRQAVVALESTLISHGLPYPQNVAVARASEAAVRLAGAVPATVAIAGGRVQVGLDDDALERLATAPAGTVLKAARPSLARGAGERRLGGDDGVGDDDRGTCRRDRGCSRRVGSAGSIAARSVGRRPSLDISSDLEELASDAGRRRVRGAEGDPRRAATLEYLETRGVPVVAVGHGRAARVLRTGFGGSGRRSPSRTSAAAARLIAAHRALGLIGGVLVCTPVPEADALPDDVARDAVERAVREAAEAGIAGPAVTPWLLARVAVLTEGASVRANTALIEHDALVAGQLAVALAG